MKKQGTVLAVIEPRQMRQPALMRALSLAMYASAHPSKSGARRQEIIAVMPVYDFSWDISSVLSVEQGRRMQQEIVDKQRAWLTAYLQVNAAGYNVRPEVIWSKNPGDDIIAIARRDPRHARQRALHAA